MIASRWWAVKPTRHGGVLTIAELRVGDLVGDYASFALGDILQFVWLKRPSVWPKRRCVWFAGVSPSSSGDRLFWERFGFITQLQWTRFENFEL